MNSLVLVKDYIYLFFLAPAFGFCVSLYRLQQESIQAVDDIFSSFFDGNILLASVWIALIRVVIAFVYLATKDCRAKKLLEISKFLSDMGLSVVLMTTGWLLAVSTWIYNFHNQQNGVATTDGGMGITLSLLFIALFFFMLQFIVAALEHAADEDSSYQKKAA